MKSVSQYLHLSQTKTNLRYSRSVYLYRFASTTLLDLPKNLFLALYRFFLFHAFPVKRQVAVDQNAKAPCQLPRSAQQALTLEWKHTKHYQLLRDCIHWLFSDCRRNHLSGMSMQFSTDEHFAC